VTVALKAGSRWKVAAEAAVSVGSTYRPSRRGPAWCSRTELAACCSALLGLAVVLPQAAKKRDDAITAARVEFLVFKGSLSIGPNDCPALRCFGVKAPDAS
jgi:hypothetical protein